MRTALAIWLCVLYGTICPGHGQLDVVDEDPSQYRNVTNGKQFTNALANLTITDIELDGVISLSPALWKPYGGGFTVVNRRVRLFHANTTAPGVLDLGGVTDQIMVGQGGVLTLQNVTLRNPAPRWNPRTASHARFACPFFGPWPSITLLPNSKIIIINVTSYFWSEPSFCETFREPLLQDWTSRGIPASDILINSSTELLLTGQHIFQRPITDRLINMDVGNTTFNVSDLRCVCLPTNPWPTYPDIQDDPPLPGPPGRVLLDAAMNKSLSGAVPGPPGGGWQHGLPLWALILVIVLPVLAALALALGIIA